MKRILRLLLIVGLLAGGLSFLTTPSQAGPFRRGWGGGYGWGRGYYGPGWGYRHVYRPYGFGWGGYGRGYPAYRWGYGGVPGYGLGMYNMGYPGFGYGYSSWGYPAVYGTSISIGRPLGGFYMGAFPF